MSVNERFVEVYFVRNAAQRMIVSQLLQNVGIQSYSVNDSMPEVFGRFPNFIRKTSTRICVQSSDVPEATTVCQEFDRRIHDHISNEDSNTPPFCFHCGEAVAANANDVVVT